MTRLKKNVVRETEICLHNRKHPIVIEITAPGIVTLWEKGCQIKYRATVEQVLQRMILQEAMELGPRKPKRRLAKRGLLGIGRHE